MEKIKLMIAEDHTFLRKSLVSSLTTHNIEVIGEASNGTDLIKLVTERPPDIVLLDLKMPEMDGYAVLENFAKEFKNIKTVIYSSYHSPFFVALTIINGAAAFVSKNSEITEIIEAIEGVYADGFYFNEIISKNILQQLRDDKKKLYYLIEDAKFSEKEIQVLKMLCDEFTLPQIAESLNISQNTVLHHKKNLFQKTESNTIVSLVKYAIKHGIVLN